MLRMMTRVFAGYTRSGCRQTAFMRYQVTRSNAIPDGNVDDSDALIHASNLRPGLTAYHHSTSASTRTGITQIATDRRFRASDSTIVQALGLERERPARPLGVQGLLGALMPSGQQTGHDASIELTTQSNGSRMACQM
jgi:hypothetical protein